MRLNVLPYLMVFKRDFDNIGRLIELIVFRAVLSKGQVISEIIFNPIYHTLEKFMPSRPPTHTYILQLK